MTKPSKDRENMNRSVEEYAASVDDLLKTEQVSKEVRDWIEEELDKIEKKLKKRIRKLDNEAH